MGLERLQRSGSGLSHTPDTPALDSRVVIANEPCVAGWPRPHCDARRCKQQQRSRTGVVAWHHQLHPDCRSSAGSQLPSTHTHTHTSCYNTTLTCDTAPCLLSAPSDIGSVLCLSPQGCRHAASTGPRALGQAGAGSSGHGHRVAALSCKGWRSEGTARQVCHRGNCAESTHRRKLPSARLPGAAKGLGSVCVGM